MKNRDLYIGVAELRRRPGNRIQVDCSVPIANASVSSAAVPTGAEGEVHLVLEALADGVTASGTVRFPWVGECRRCLGETTGEVTADVFEVFKDQVLSEDMQPFDGDFVDLGPAVRDAVVLALPLAPLCREGCSGPEPSEYPVVVEGTSPATPDPRWDALSGLRFDPDDAE